MNIFTSPLPNEVVASQLEKNNKSFSVEDVRRWVEKHDGVHGRFRFYSLYAASSEFYQLVAKPLVSMRTVGSINVERRAKPIKHTIMTKKRNRLRDPKGVALYRASENLNHIMAAKKALGKKINDSLLG